MSIAALLPSRMRHRLTLQQASQSADGAGGFTRSWSTIADLWGEIAPVSGAEKLDADQLTSRITHKITIRYRTDVSNAMRFLYDGRVFHVCAMINVMERKRTLQILAEEGNLV